MTLTLHRTYAAPSAGIPKVTFRKGNCDKAPLLVEFEVDLSGCTFDNTENYDALFNEDFTGRTHSPEKHRLLFLWDLDDDEAEWTAPENIPASYVNRSKALGAKVSHVYTRSQTVNWKLEIIEPSSGKKAYASGSFTVVDPLKTADHIVLVNANGDSDFSEINRADYPGATFHEVQLAAGNAFGNGTEFSAYVDFDNVCWLFKTGGTYLLTVNHQGAGDWPYFGKYGTTSSANPIIDLPDGVRSFATNQLGPGHVKELRIQDLDAMGDWNDYETVGTVTFTTTAFLQCKGGWRYIIADCSATAVDGQYAYLSNANITNQEIHVAIANTVLHGIAGKEYPIIIGDSAGSPNTTLTFVGNRMTDFDTLLSGSGQGTINPGHRAFIRINSPHHAHVRGCDFFRLAGGHGQPILKLNKASRTNAYLGVQFCAGEGSENFVNFVEDKTGQPVAVQNAGICECCIFLHLPEGQMFMGAASTGNTLRSCLLVTGRWSDPALSQNQTTYRSRGIMYPGGAGIYPTGDEAPNELYNCHAIHLRTQAQNAGRLWGPVDAAYDMNGLATVGDAPQRFRYAGIFIHSPYQTDGTAFDPVKDDPTLESDGILRPDGTRMRFRFKGWNPSGTPDPTYSYNGEFVPSGEFKSGSTAIGAGRPPLVWPLDYLGRICGPKRAHGATDDPGYVFDLKVRAG